MEWQQKLEREYIYIYIYMYIRIWHEDKHIEEEIEELGIRRGGY